VRFWREDTFLGAQRVKNGDLPIVRL